MGNLVDQYYNQYYNKKPNNCMDCMFHMEYPDLNSYDMNSHNDKKIVCAINMRTVIARCRPYLLRGQCHVPNWCHFVTDYNISRINEKERE